MWQLGALYIVLKSVEIVYFALLGLFSLLLFLYALFQILGPPASLNSA